jgi:hypothetical protein
VVGVTDEIAEYMDNHSNRNVLLCELPIVYSVFDAATIFNWSDISAREIFYYGSIPALIYEAYLSKTINDFDYLPFAKRDLMIEKCIDNGLVTDESVIALLSSFITGEKKSILLPLHQLMNTGADKKLRWIPFHMVEALRNFSGSLKNAPELKMVVVQVVSLFDNFFNGSYLDGKGWEALFLIVLLIRLVSRQFDPLFLPFEELED